MGRCSDAGLRLALITQAKGTPTIRVSHRIFLLCDAFGACLLEFRPEAVQVMALIGYGTRK